MGAERAPYYQHYTNARRKFPPGVRTRAMAESCLLLNDPNPDLGLHVGVEAHRHLVDAEGPDRLVKVDLALLDLGEALRMKLLRDVGGGYRSEQLVLFADARGEGQRDLLEAVGERLRLRAALVLRRLQVRLLARDALAVAGGRFVGEPAGEKKVSAVAGRHRDDVARLAEVVDCLLENDFHHPVSYTHLRAHETDSYLVCRLLLEKK